MEYQYLTITVAVLEAASGVFGVMIADRLNGAEIAALPPGYALQEEFESFACSAIVPLTSGDVLDLALYRAAGGAVLFGSVQNAALQPCVALFNNLKFA